MNERDFQLILRAKRQIDREATWRSFLLFGLLFAAALRFMGIDLPFLYLLLFVLFFISLLLTSDLLVNIGKVSKKELISVIEKNIHNDPDTLMRYANSRERSAL